MKKHPYWSMFKRYFELSINDRINLRQERNSLNINHLFSTAITGIYYPFALPTYPKINNGLYHPIGKNHSKYPAKNIFQ